MWDSPIVRAIRMVEFPERSDMTGVRPSYLRHSRSSNGGISETEELEYERRSGSEEVDNEF
jgi:hypothetical protein